MNIGLGRSAKTVMPIYKVKVKLATLIEGDPKAPFSIATTPGYKGRHYSISCKVKLASIVESDSKAFSIKM